MILGIVGTILGVVAMMILGIVGASVGVVAIPFCLLLDFGLAFDAPPFLLFHRLLEAAFLPPQLLRLPQRRRRTRPTARWGCEVGVWSEEVTSEEYRVTSGSEW